MSIMQSGSPIMAFSHNFEMALLDHGTSQVEERPTLAQHIFSIDIRDAKSVWILPESIVDYAVRGNIPPGSLDLDDLPFGIKVADMNHSHLSSEVIMRAAIAKTISSGKSMEEVIATASLCNSMVRLLSYTFVSGAISVSSESAFFNRFIGAIQSATFDTLEYLTVESTPIELNSATKDLLLRGTVSSLGRKPSSFKTLLKPIRLGCKTLAEQYKVPGSPRKWLMNIMNEERATNKSTVVRRVMTAPSLASLDILYPQPQETIPSTATGLSRSGEKKRPPRLALPRAPVSTRPGITTATWLPLVLNKNILTPPYSPSVYSSIASVEEEEEEDSPRTDKSMLDSAGIQSPVSARSPFSFDYF